VTVLLFAAVFAGMGVADARTAKLAPALLVLGTFLGSTLWWLVLTCTIHLFRAKFDQHSLRWLNRIAGIMLLSFGVSSILGLL
jgi:arginine exporter protein ArgO